MNNFLSKIVFCLLGLASFSYGWDDYDTEGLVFEYTPVVEATKVSDSDCDRPATNEGLHWMKKKSNVQSKVSSAKSKKKNKEYACYGSLKSTADSFGYGSCKPASGNKTWVRSHTRVCKSGKVTRVRGHWRKK
jgi:hypothetical protein